MDEHNSLTIEQEEAWTNLLLDLQQTFKRMPDLQSILFLIGVQELGQLHRDFTKEEKQDLMHLGVCKLLSEDDYFRFIGRDEEGWPHYEPSQNLSLDVKGLAREEVLLKQQILRYFDKIY